MKFRFTIGRKIGTGFGVVILLIVGVFLYTNNVLNVSQSINEKINYTYNPTLQELTKLKEQVVTSQKLIETWAFVPSRPDVANKKHLLELTEKTVPDLQARLDTLHILWKEVTPDTSAEYYLLDTLESIWKNIDEMFVLHKEVQELLPDFESYNDAMARFEVRPKVEPEGPIDVATIRVMQSLDQLTKDVDAYSVKLRGEMDGASDRLMFWMRWLGIALVIGGLLVALFTVRSIVKPVNRLRDILLEMARGILPQQKIQSSDDEIGEMSEALNSLVGGLKRTTEFSREVGSGNFDFEHQPLSDEDILGHALLKMRDDLAENERMLELKVKQRTEEVVKQKEELEHQKERIEELYKDVTDSIRYAKRIQESILPSENYIKSLVPDSFVLYRPKDIVSGDFYWFEKSNSKVLFAAVDCTGHGVPGAFMSLVGHNGLNQAVKEHQLDEPAKILHDLDLMANETLNQGDTENNVRDGMDLAVCSLDMAQMRLEYAGAYNPLYLIRNGELLQTKADKFAIGGRSLRQEKQYTNHQIELEQGDIIYIFSDGYADQFGGSRGKKFMYKQFRDLLLKIHDRPMEEQKDVLNATIESWKGSFEQVDDILVIGVRV